MFFDRLPARPRDARALVVIGPSRSAGLPALAAQPLSHARAALGVRSDWCAQPGGAAQGHGTKEINP